MKNTNLLQYPHIDESTGHANGHGSVPSLSVLSLNKNPIGFRGVKFMALMLAKYRTCHSLRQLSLRNTLGGAGYVDLCRVLLADRRLLEVQVSMSCI